MDKNKEQKVCKSTLLSYYYPNQMLSICHGVCVVHVTRSIPYQHCGLSVGKGFGWRKALENHLNSEL